MFLPLHLRLRRDCYYVSPVCSGKSLQLEMITCDRDRQHPINRSTLSFKALSVYDGTRQPWSYLLCVCASGIQTLLSPRVSNEERASAYMFESGCLTVAIVKSLGPQQSSKHYLEHVAFPAMHPGWCEHFYILPISPICAFLCWLE